MRKSIGILLCLTLVFGLSLDLSAQANDDLDQLELLKQFIGTWQGEVGKDTLLKLIYEPFGDGIVFTQEVQTNGETFWIVKSGMGVSQDKKTTMGLLVRQDGIAIPSHGKFVSNDKIVFELQPDNLKHSLLIREVTFQSPDVFSVREKYRGENMSWDEEWEETQIFHKIK